MIFANNTPSVNGIVTIGGGIESSSRFQAMVAVPPVTSSFTLISDTAYWVYLGRTLQTTTINHVKFLVASAGVGAQTAEIALASGTGEPAAAAMSLTKLTANGTLDTLITTGLKGNTSAMGYSVAPGTFLYVGLRTAMATTQPSLNGRYRDYGHGYLLRTVTAGALTGAGPWTGALLTGADITATVAIGPDLRTSAA